MPPWPKSPYVFPSSVFVNCAITCIFLYVICVYCNSPGLSILHPPTLSLSPFKFFVLPPTLINTHLLLKMAQRITLLFSTNYQKFFFHSLSLSLYLPCLFPSISRYRAFVNLAFWFFVPQFFFLPGLGNIPPLGLRFFVG